jgi:hypothetical protein
MLLDIRDGQSRRATSGRDSAKVFRQECQVKCLKSNARVDFSPYSRK